MLKAYHAIEGRLRIMSIIETLKNLFEPPEPVTKPYYCRKCERDFEVPIDAEVKCTHCGNPGGVTFQS